MSLIIFNFFILARINELKKVKVEYGISKDSKGKQRKNARITIPESKTDTIKRGVTMRMRCCCDVEGTQLANGVKLCPVCVFKDK